MFKQKSPPERRKTFLYSRDSQKGEEATWRKANKQTIDESNSSESVVSFNVWNFLTAKVNEMESKRRKWIFTFTQIPFGSVFTCSSKKLSEYQLNDKNFGVFFLSRLRPRLRRFSNIASPLRAGEKFEFSTRVVPRTEAKEGKIRKFECSGDDNANNKVLVVFREFLSKSVKMFCRKMSIFVAKFH